MLLEELVELSANEQFKLNLKFEHQEFRLKKQIPILCTAIWAIAKKLFIAFSLSYLYERECSVAINQLTEKELLIVQRRRLRLLVTKNASNMDKLVSSQKAYECTNSSTVAFFVKNFYYSSLNKTLEILDFCNKYIKRSDFAFIIGGADGITI